MRVISGTAKGRALKAVPGTNTRPTTDKVKEAIFSMIGPYFDGGNVLDLFAGTGGLGIEALSRGMERAVFIDLEKKSLDVVQENLKAARLEDRAEMYRTDAFRALKALAKREQRFALFFFDPPYRMKVIGELLESVQELGLAEPGAVFVAEHDSEYDPPEVAGRAERIRQTAYGDTAVSIYRLALEESDAEVETHESEDRPSDSRANEAVQSPDGHVHDKGGTS